MKSNQKEISSYKLCILPGSDPDPSFRAEYRQAYETWRDVWSRTFSQELKIENKPVTESFTRQHEILGLFYESTCAGLIALRWVDFSLIDFSEDSYFSKWTSLDIAKLTEFGPRILLVTNMAVATEFRRSVTGINFRDILLDLSLRRFVTSQADAVGCITRKERNVHKLFYAMGARAIQSDVSYFKEEDKIDLVVIYRDEIRGHKDDQVFLQSDFLWKSKLEVAQRRSLLLNRGPQPQLDMGPERRSA